MKYITTIVVLLLCTITASAQLFVLKEVDGTTSYIHLSNNALAASNTANCISYADHDFLYNSNFSNRMGMKVYSCDNPHWSRTNFRAFSYDMKVLKVFSVLYSGQEVDSRTFNLSDQNTYIENTSNNNFSNNSSSSRSNSSSSSSSGNLLAKGTYTVNSQGYSTTTGQYTGYLGGDFVVSVEFYDDHIVVLSSSCKYVGTYNGYKKYKGDTMSWLGTSTNFYYVDSNYNMYKETVFSSQYGTDVFRYTMAKGEVTLPKGEVYNPSSGSGSYNNGTGGSTRNSNRTSSTISNCSLCHGSGRIVRDSSVPTYGKDYKVKCNECGGWFMKSTGHSHITCPQCHGR